MTIFITILIVLFFLGVLVFLFTCLVGSSTLKKYTDNDSAIVFGSKGKGKSLIFQHIANQHKYGYVSNTDFGGYCVNCKPSDISVAPNNWENIIQGVILPIEKNPLYEKRPVLLDDASIYFPNFAEDKLKKYYNSMPVAFALWRHLYDSPIHINTQDVNRTWKLLREQQSYFILARGCISFPFFIYVKYTLYDRIETASQKIKPFKSTIGNKFSKAEKDKFNSTNGLVKNYHFIILKKNIHYDSRYFHTVLFKSSINSKTSKKFLKDTYKQYKLAKKH